MSNVRYGGLVDCSIAGFPMGFGYFTAVPAAPEDLPARREAAERSFAERIWREDLERWDTEVKPASIRAHVALTEIDLGDLDDAALATHVARCVDHYLAMAEQHHHFNAASTMPLLDFVLHAKRWTDRGVNEILALAEGASAVSRGEGPELLDAVAAIRSDRQAVGILSRTDDLDALAGLGGEVSATVTRFRSHVGARLATGFDFANPTAEEVPGLLARVLRSAVEGPALRSDDVLRERTATIRAAVPSADRELFDDLLGEARHVWRLRDERGVYSDAWAAGLLRRAVLAAGKRLTERGLLAEPEHLLDSTAGELRAWLEGDEAVVSADLESRAAQREALRDRHVPEFLGPPRTPPVVPDGWPARAADMIDASRLFTFPPAAATAQDGPLRGTPASPGSCEGRARVVLRGADLARVEDGDILVMPSTSEAVCVVVPLLAGVVTDHGGLISHAAIVAREVGIPAVVGCGNATTQIRDGDVVRVDGTTGEVVVLERQ